MLLFLSVFYLRLSISCFLSSRSLLGSILSSQTDPPTLKNDGFMVAGARFLKNHHFRSKDGFGSVLGASRLHFGRSWGSLGVSWGFSRGPRASKIFEAVSSRSISVALGTLLGFVCLLLAAENGLWKFLGSYLAFFLSPPRAFGRCFCTR